MDGSVLEGRGNGGLAVAWRFATAPAPCLEPNELPYLVGERQTPVFIFTAGDVLIRARQTYGRNELVAMLPVAGISGEISQLALPQAGMSRLRQSRAAGPFSIEWPGQLVG